ncbi:response regulator receiver protein [Desulfarculus baarsii DSM 2075]|uniref:Response regulator receiver protein n=1 Tax=Desulfarculus baarsii (strain ATCC 33931 / DSM 2075 / LMG 7858 / VKM B-1802 / 2st14) TaxID=644282 RepID=E1QFY3_DESB2|nr:response regulator [Desulfarculus baarsii]ADK84593.1 response regulator receiver protein [Desulfarculus baarsii DSM 2075]
MSCDKPNDEKLPVRPSRILVADDEDALRELLKRFLETKGHQVVLAQDGREALKLFREQPFDLVLSDVRMPGLDGLQLLAAVKDINPRTPVVLISGYGDIETVVTALKAGAENFLAKPIRIDMLRRVVSQSLSLSARSERRADHFPNVTQQTQIDTPSQQCYINDIIYLIAASAAAVGYVSHDLDNNLKLALVEAIMNAMEHGNKWDENKKIHLTVTIGADMFKIVIADEGPGFDPDKLPDPTSPEQLLAERGRGVFLMRAIMDEITYNQRGNEVTMVKGNPGKAVEQA